MEQEGNGAVIFRPFSIRKCNLCQTEIDKGKYCNEACKRQAKLGRVKIYRLNNLDTIREKDRARSKVKRIRRYGITLEQYDQMYISQNGKCAICRLDKPLNIDHDHSCCDYDGSCGKCVRGLLCKPCNTGLGNFKDDSSFLSSAQSYLDNNGTY